MPQHPQQAAGAPAEQPGATGTRNGPQAVHGGVERREEASGGSAIVPPAAEPLDLDLIEARAAHLYEYTDLPDDAEILAGTEVPALVAEVQQLRRALDHSERIRENVDFHLGQEMARRQTAEKETAHLAAELAKYVGAEPIIAEEMAYVSRCLHAVYDLCTEAKRSGSLGITPEAVEQAADGEWTADTPRPALPWAHAMDDSDLHLFLDDLVSAAMGRWRSDPDIPIRTVLADIEKMCGQWRTPGQGLRSDEPETAET